MSISETSNSNIYQWIITLLVIAIVLFIVLIIAHKDSKRLNKPQRPAVKAETHVNSIQLKKASEEALNKATEQMISSYKINFERQLNQNMNLLNKTFKDNVSSATIEFQKSLQDFQIKSKTMTEEAQAQIVKATDLAEQQMQYIAKSKKDALLHKVDSSLNNILVGYLNNSLEGTIDLNDQQDYIFEKLEKNKSLIIEDITNAKF